MQNSHGERRREYRIPVTLSGSMCARHGTRKTRVQIQDMSKFGVRAVLEAEGGSFDVGDAVEVQLSIPEKGEEEKLSVPGEIRWKKTVSPDKCCAGIAFQEPISFNFPIETVASICSRLLTPSDPKKDLAPSKMIADSVLEFFEYMNTGVLVTACIDSCNRLLANIRGRLDFAAIRYEHSASESKHGDNAKDEELYTVLNSTHRDLLDSSEKLKDLAQFFQLIRHKTIHSPERFILSTDAKTEIERSFDTVVKLVHLFNGKNAKPDFRMDLSPLPLLAIRPVDFVRCFDACLLGVLRSALESSGSLITVRSLSRSEGVEIILEHNGSKILQADRIHIDPFWEKLPISAFASRDRQTLRWFCLALLPLREYGGSIDIHSESGKNLIHLRIPAEYTYDVYSHS